MKLVVNLTEIDALMGEYMQRQTFSNNYMLQDELSRHIKNKELYTQLEGDNAFLFLKKAGFYRMYYYLNDIHHPFNVDSNLPIVQEILYRGEKRYPEKEVSYWTSVGFKSHLGRDCYFLKASDAAPFLANAEDSRTFGTSITTLSTDHELDEANLMIREYLDLYTGDILTMEELWQFSKRDELFGIYVENQLAGVLQAEFKNNIYWLGHVVVKEEFRGRGLSSKLLKLYFKKGLQKECRQFQLWVIDNNESALSLYKKYGFEYINKSTISLLKS